MQPLNLQASLENPLSSYLSSRRSFGVESPHFGIAQLKEQLKLDGFPLLIGPITPPGLSYPSEGFLRSGPGLSVFKGASSQYSKCLGLAEEGGAHLLSFGGENFTLDNDSKQGSFRYQSKADCFGQPIEKRVTHRATRELLAPQEVIFETSADPEDALSPKFDPAVPSFAHDAKFRFNNQTNPGLASSKAHQNLPSGLKVIERQAIPQLAYRSDVDPLQPILCQNSPGTYNQKPYQQYDQKSNRHLKSNDEFQNKRSTSEPRSYGESSSQDEDEEELEELIARVSKRAATSQRHKGQIISGIFSSSQSSQQQSLQQDSGPGHFAPHTHTDKLESGSPAVQSADQENVLHTSCLIKGSDLRGELATHYSKKIAKHSEMDCSSSRPDSRMLGAQTMLQTSNFLAGRNPNFLMGKSADFTEHRNLSQTHAGSASLVGPSGFVNGHIGAASSLALWKDPEGCTASSLKFDMKKLAQENKENLPLNMISSRFAPQTTHIQESQPRGIASKTLGFLTTAEPPSKNKHLTVVTSEIQRGLEDRNTTPDHKLKVPTRSMGGGIATRLAKKLGPGQLRCTTPKATQECSQVPPARCSTARSGAKQAAELAEKFSQTRQTYDSREPLAESHFSGGYLMQSKDFESRTPTRSRIKCFKKQAGPQGHNLLLSSQGLHDPIPFELGSRSPGAKYLTQEATATKIGKPDKQQLQASRRGGVLAGQAPVHLHLDLRSPRLTDQLPSSPTKSKKKASESGGSLREQLISRVGRSGEGGLSKETLKATKVMMQSSRSFKKLEQTNGQEPHLGEKSGLGFNTLSKGELKRFMEKRKLTHVPQSGNYPIPMATNAASRSAIKLKSKRKSNSEIQNGASPAPSNRGVTPPSRPKKREVADPMFLSTKDFRRLATLCGQGSNIPSGGEGSALRHSANGYLRNGEKLGEKREKEVAISRLSYFGPFRTEQADSEWGRSQWVREPAEQESRNKSSMVQQTSDDEDCRLSRTVDSKIPQVDIATLSHKVIQQLDA